MLREYALEREKNIKFNENYDLIGGLKHKNVPHPLSCEHQMLEFEDFEDVDKEDPHE